MAKRYFYFFSFFLFVALFSSVSISSAEKIELVRLVVADVEQDTVSNAEIDGDSFYPESTINTSVSAPRTRFKTPDTVFRGISGFDRISQHPAVPVNSLIAIQSYRQPYFLSQQYSYLFRLTPF